MAHTSSQQEDTPRAGFVPWVVDGRRLLASPSSAHWICRHHGRVEMAKGNCEYSIRIHPILHAYPDQWPSSAHWIGRDCRVEMVKGNLTFLVWKRSGERTLLNEAHSLLHHYGAISRVENLEKEVQDRYQLPLSVIVEFEMFDARRDVLSSKRIRRDS
ncbi:hypothetical protein EDB80DRAFT_867289 [Ilyonectria destructans]|nr:hypothetical protein EDB80DRAFT_867289 [Ilyonectria destructans]